MNINQLQYFMEVYTSENFQSAATTLGITRQALSKTIASLEEDLGQKLFHRCTRGVTPTDYALSILPHVRNLLHEYSEIDGLKTLASQSGSVVSISALDHIFSYFGPKFLIDFHNDFPNIILSIVESTDDEAIRSLSEKRTSFAIVTGPVDTSRFICTPLFFTHYCIRLSKNHPLACKEKIEYSDLEGQTILGKGRSYSCFREHFDKKILLCGIHVNIMAETTDESLIRAIVKNSNVLNIGYDYAALSEKDDDIVIKKFGEDGDIGQMVYLVREKISYQSVSCQRFEEYLVKWIKSHLTM